MFYCVVKDFKHGVVHLQITAAVIGRIAAPKVIQLQLGNSLIHEERLNPPKNHKK